MGILNFYKSVREKYPEAFKSEWLDSYDHVYSDVNCCLHNCAYKANSKEEIYNRLYKFYDGIMLNLMPYKSITFSSDGSAPLAKVLLQRKRRQEIGKDLDQKVDNSSLMFTPGTVFMNTLKDKISNYINFLKNVYAVNINYLNTDFDEAELKLKKCVMDNMQNYPNDTHILITNDSDVIAMLTTLPDFSNVYVMCKFGKDIEIVSVRKLIDLHTTKYGCGHNYGLDFTCLSIMLGNDYLPRIQCIDFDKIWDSYKLIIKKNPVGMILKKDNGFEINKKFFIDLLSTFLSKIPSGKQKKINMHNAYDDLYTNYMDGFTWCLDTYISGKCKRYNYMYTSKENPHPFGLILNISVDPKNLCVSEEQYEPLSCEIYAMLLLPKNAMSLIDVQYHEFMKNSKKLYIDDSCESCDKMTERIKSITDQTEILNLNKKIRNHKKFHDNIELEDIYDFIEKYKLQKINC